MKAASPPIMEPLAPVYHLPSILREGKPGIALYVQDVGVGASEVGAGGAEARRADAFLAAQEAAFRLRPDEPAIFVVLRPGDPEAPCRIYPARLPEGEAAELELPDRPELLARAAPGAISVYAGAAPFGRLRRLPLFGRVEAFAPVELMPGAPVAPFRTACLLGPAEFPLRLGEILARAAEFFVRLLEEKRGAPLGRVMLAISFPETPGAAPLVVSNSGFGCLVDGLAAATIASAAGLLASEGL